MVAATARRDTRVENRGATREMACASARQDARIENDVILANRCPYRNWSARIRQRVPHFGQRTCITSGVGATPFDCCAVFRLSRVAFLTKGWSDLASIIPSKAHCEFRHFMRCIDIIYSRVYCAAARLPYSCDLCLLEENWESRVTLVVTSAAVAVRRRSAAARAASRTSSSSARTTRPS